MTQLVKLEELEHTAVRDVYRLLVDDSPAIRRAAAELVAGSLEEQGRRQLDLAAAATQAIRRPASPAVWPGIAHAEHRAAAVAERLLCVD